MVVPESVVIDTSAFYALISDDDRFHDSAIETYNTLTNENVELWTTSYALVETIALVHRRLGFRILAQLLDIIESNVQVFFVESGIHAMAMQEFISTKGRGLSLVDWTVVLVARIKSAHVFTFDRRMAYRVVSVVPSS